MNIWFILLILLGLAILISSVGYKKYVWFISIGYGFSIVGIGAAIIIIYSIRGTLNITGLIASILFIIYGIRLGGFLFIRELKNMNYRKTLNEVSKDGKTVPFGVKISIHLIVAMLYVAQTSGVTFSLYINQYQSFFDFKIIEIIGVSIMAFGILLESIADYQKSKYKKENPNMPAMKGLYKFVRCPNYYGEMLFWTGTVTFSILTLNTWWMWVIAILGYLCILYVMLNSSKRLEIRQNKNYNDLVEFQEYKKKTPLIILVFIPIKSLEKSKIIM